MRRNQPVGVTWQIADDLACWVETRIVHCRDDAACGNDPAHRGWRVVADIGIGDLVEEQGSIASRNGDAKSCRPFVRAIGYDDRTPSIAMIRGWISRSTIILRICASPGRASRRDVTAYKNGLIVGVY